jgi:hypothetical protein
MALHNLANLFNCMSEHHRALSLHKQCLEMRRHSHGDDHPDTLQTIYGISESLFFMGLYHHALPSYESCFQSRQRVLGHDHPLTEIAQRSRDTCQGRISLQICSVMFGFRASVSLCMLKLPLWRALHAQHSDLMDRQFGMLCALAVSVSLKQRRRMLCAGAVGLLCLRICTDFQHYLLPKLPSTSSASGMMPHRDVKRIITSVARRVAAVTSVRDIASFVD